jgi:glutamate-5-semialdehyde dehydrogenase
MARCARKAATVLASLPRESRDAILLTAAETIINRSAEILAANALDCEAAHRDLAAGRMTSSLFDRLRLTEKGVVDMAEKVRAVAALDDPLGRTLAKTKLDDDLMLHKVSCPLGVIGIIFESRPDVIPQVGALCLKSGNAVLLKGGKEAAQTNEVLAQIWRDSLNRFPQLSPDAVSLLHTREDVSELLKLEQEIDLIIPRGSREFVHYVASHSRVPVLGHGEGVCHVYVDRAADLDKALAVAFDSKVQYPAACNAMETLLVHQDVAPTFLPAMIERFREARVEIRGCPRTVALAGPSTISPAAEADWITEYSELIISIRVVNSADEAIEHIQRYGSRHTECIMTEDQALAKRFMDHIDAANVYHNASTRFADGYRYGLGAELGISTSKLHARGPVGLEGLTTYKYQLFGNGHTVASYQSGERSFKHLKL